MADGSLLLRVWVGLVAVVALVSGVQCFLDPEYPLRRIYTLSPHEATPLFSRMFGTWTILAAVVRFLYALFPRNEGLFLAALYSFLLALGHFLSEMFIFGTVDVSFGSISALVVAGVSSCWMIGMVLLRSNRLDQRKKA